MPLLAHFLFRIQADTQPSTIKKTSYNNHYHKGHGHQRVCGHAAERNRARAGRRRKGAERTAVHSGSGGHPSRFEATSANIDLLPPEALETAMETWLPPALTAIAALKKLSVQLIIASTLKVALWRRVLGSAMMMTAVNNTDCGYCFHERELDGTIHDWMIEDESFPCVEIEFRHPTGVKLGDAVTEQIHRFMVTPAEQTTVPTSQVSSKVAQNQEEIAFGLKFTHCRLSTSCLVLIQKLLEQIFVHRDHQYGVSVPDLSYSLMGEADVAVVRSILVLVGMYGVPEVKLERIFHPNSATLEGHDPPLLLTTTEWTIIEKSSRGALSDFSRSLPFVRKLDIENNYASLKCLASLCSALRYGLTLEELSFGKSTVGSSDLEDTRQCWRRIAFGLFRP